MAIVNMLQRITCKMNAGKSLFILDLNEGLSDCTNGVWSILKKRPDTEYETAFKY